MGKILNILIFSISISVLAQENLDTDITSLFYKGYDHMYTHKDSAYFYFDKAYKLAQDHHAYDTQLQILSYKIYTNGYHYDMLEFGKNLNEEKSLLARDSIGLSAEDIALYEEQLSIDFGNYYYKLKQYSRAKPYFLEVYKKLASKKEKELTKEEVDTLLSVYNFLASIYKNTGKFDLAVLYYKKAKALSTNFYSGNALTLNLAATDQLLAQTYSDIGELDEADKIFRDNLKTYASIYEQDKKYKNNLLAGYRALVENHIRQGHFNKALLLLKSSERFLLPKDPFYKNFLLLHGQVYAGLNEEKKALEYYTKALEEYQEYRQYRPHQDLADVYMKVSQFHLDKKDFKSGLAQVDMALKSAGTEMDIAVPDPQTAFSKRQLLTLLDLKNQHLILAYNTTHDHRYLDNAIETNKVILETFSLLKKEFESKLDKQFLSQNVYPIFSRMMDISFEAYELHEDGELIELALTISEKNKDIFLRDALRDANTTLFNNVPNAVLDKESQFLNTINATEKSIFETTNTNELASLNSALFRLKDDYYQFLDSVSTNYPTYYDLKFQEKEIRLKDLRTSTVFGDKALICYTMGTESLYIIALDEEKERFVKIPFGPDETKAINQFYSHLSKPSIKTKSEIDTLAKELYKLVLTDTKNLLEHEEIRIIPDGVLHYLPFEALINQNGDYLLTTHNISYSSSISTLLELKKKKVKNNGDLIAFAPSFDSGSNLETNRLGLGPLLYNKKEVDAITAYFDTDAFTNHEATLNRFNDHASNYKIIHLATHASANDEFPDYSYLAFAETDSVSSTLYIKDLYNRTINADLVTLSACQTGIGTLRKGEGMVSLSKGFYYAGAKSLVKSLWKINDKSTAILMEHFYEELGKGSSKDEALRQAKLKYLASIEDQLLKHPYYWAAFTVSGNTAAVSTDYLWWNLGISAFIFSGIIILLISKRKLRLF